MKPEFDPYIKPPPRLINFPMIYTLCYHSHFNLHLLYEYHHFLSLAMSDVQVVVEERGLELSTRSTLDKSIEETSASL